MFIHSVIEKDPNPTVILINFLNSSALDSGFHAVDSGFLVSGIRFRIPWAEFLIPKPWIPEFHVKKRITRIPECRLPYVGRNNLILGK